MEIILIANEKGGTAKTTTALELASVLTALGFRVLGVDMDPSGNFSAAALPEYPKYYLYDVFKRSCAPQDAIVHTDICDVLPTLKDFVPEQSGFGVETERKSLGQLADSWIGRRGGEYMLASLLRDPAVGICDRYDFVILDSAPSDNILVTNCIIAADSVIVPCEPASLSYNGLMMFISSISETRQCYRTNVSFDGLVFTKYSETWKDYRENADAIRETMLQSKMHVYNTRFRMSASVEKSIKNNRPILDYMYQGCGAEDAVNFTLEFLERRGMAPKKKYPGVFQDEENRWIFRKNGDKYISLHWADSVAKKVEVNRQEVFHVDLLNTLLNPTFTSQIGETVFFHEHTLQKYLSLQGATVSDCTEGEIDLLKIALHRPELLCKEARRCVKEFTVGSWVAASEKQHFPASKDGKQYCYESKQEAVDDLAACFLDDRKNKTVRRLASGEYVYEFPDVDDRRTRHEYTITRITPKNRDQLLENALCQMYENDPRELLDEPF